MLFKTVTCYVPSSARRARFKAVRSKQVSQFIPPVKRFKLWRSGPRPLTSFRTQRSGASRRWAMVRTSRLFRSRSAFRRTIARKRRLLAQFFYYARIAGWRGPATLRLYRLTRPIGLLGLLQRHQLRRATFYPLTNAQLLTDYSATVQMEYGRLVRPFLLRGSRRTRSRRVRVFRRRPLMLSASVRRTLFKAYLAAPLPGRYRMFRAFYAAWLKPDRWVFSGFRALAVHYNYYTSFYARRFQRVSYRRLVHCIQILKSISPLSFVLLPKLRRRRRAGLKNRRGRRYSARARFVKSSARIRFGRSAGFRWYFCCSDVLEDSNVVKWWFALRRRRMLGRRLRRICILRFHSAFFRPRRKRTRGYRRRRASLSIRWLRSVRVRTHYRRFRARTKSAKRFAYRLGILRTLNVVRGSYRRYFTASQSTSVKRLLVQAHFFRGLAGMHTYADSDLVSPPIAESSDDNSSAEDLDTCDVVRRPAPTPLARAFYAAIRRCYVLRRFNHSGLLLRVLTRVYSRARRRRARNPRFVRAPRNILHTAQRLRWIRRCYYRRIQASRLLSRRIWVRPARSKRLRLRRFFRRTAKRRYVSRTRRRGWRNFRRWPNIGYERSRLRRSRVRRYNSILRRFVPRLRFRKRRRARRFFRRKQRLVPMTSTGRRRRRLYFAIPRVFKRRSLVYVHITRTVNNVFYSVFSRRQRLLATFSNGRTEFTGSKRMSVVATEVAAKSLAAYLRANKVRYIYFVFTTRFNQFMRAAVRVLRAKKLRIAGFKYTARRPHSLGLRLRASRRV